MFSKSVSDSKTWANKTNTLPNPNPSNYKIIREKAIDKFILIEINYPDCKNYEGNKILLFENTTIHQLKMQKLIDPHFSDNLKFHSPIARFEPTEKGWGMALRLIEINK